MSGDDIAAALALAGIPLVGLPYASWMRLHGPLLAAASWLLGAGLVGAGMLLLSVAHVGFGRPSLGLLWAILVIAGGLLSFPGFVAGKGAWERAAPASGSSARPGSRVRHDGDGRDARAPENVPHMHNPGFRTGASALPRLWAGFRLACVPKPSPISCLLLTVCAFQCIYTFLQAVRVPLGSFDAWSLWEFKGRRFWLDGAVSGAFLHDHAAIFAHPGYPPLLPLLITWVYTWTGTPDPALMKPVYPLFYCALLLAFYAALQVRLGPRWALLATTALSLVPRVTDYAGTGLADVPLAAYLVAGSAAAVAALVPPGGADRRGTPRGCPVTATLHPRGVPLRLASDLRRAVLGGQDARRMLAAGLLFGLAMCTKREGALFFLAACGSQVLIERSWRRLAAWAWPALAVGLPWYLYIGLTGVPDRDFLPATPANLVAHAGRLGGIARLFALNMLAVDEWSILWFAFAAVLLLALVQRRLRAGPLLLPVLVPLILYVIALSLSAWPDPDLHVRTSLDRLILVTAPFALWFICEQLLAPTSQRQPASPQPGPAPDTGP